MDSITHIVLGACVGEAIAGRKLGKKAMLFGAIANSVPDIDVIASLWLRPIDNFLAHRGFTHSILFAVLFSILAGWIMKKIFHRYALSYKEWFILIGINVFIHLLIDAFTAYGTGLFEPFSHDRIALHMVFVADPFFTLPLVVSCIALLILKTKSPVRKIWALTGIFLCTGYCCYALFNKIRVDEVVKKNLQRENMESEKFIATPTPLNNFLWYVIADRDSGFDIGYYSVFDRSPDIHFSYVPKNDKLLPKGDLDVKKLIRFSEGYYSAVKTNDTLIFRDLRFGQVGGWFDGQAPFIFQYRLLIIKKNAVPLQQARFKASGGEALKQMIERIKGI